MIIKALPLLGFLGAMVVFASPAKAVDDGTSNTIGFGETSGVPEPSTWATMIVGFGAVAVAMRRDKRRMTDPSPKTAE